MMMDSDDGRSVKKERSKSHSQLSFHGNNESMETAETAAIYSSTALVFRPQSKVFISSDCYFAHQRTSAYCTTFRRPQCLSKTSFIGIDDRVHHDVASANSTNWTLINLFTPRWDRPTSSETYEESYIHPQLIFSVNFWIALVAGRHWLGHYFMIFDTWFFGNFPVRSMMPTRCVE